MMEGGKTCVAMMQTADLRNSGHLALCGGWRGKPRPSRPECFRWGMIELNLTSSIVILSPGIAGLVRSEGRPS